jgi:hypothetical protein
MGYTHYFSYDPDSPAFIEAWPSLREDSGRVLDRVEAAGIRIDRDTFGGTLPPEYELIAFNGPADDVELYCEPLTVKLSWPGQPPRGTGENRVAAFCKTGRLPYDVAVAAFLLRCHKLMPDEFAINSDGRWDDEWRGGAMRPAPGGLSARGVVAELFGDDDPACPFDPDWART